MFRDPIDDTTNILIHRDAPFLDEPPYHPTRAIKVTSSMYGPLRFAHKYGFTKLHTRLSRVLQSHWPVTLDQWDARCYRWPEHAPELQPGAYTLCFTPPQSFEWHDLNTRLRFFDQACY